MQCEWVFQSLVILGSHPLCVILRRHHGHIAIDD